MIGIVAVVSVVGLVALLSSRSGDFTRAADLQLTQGSRTRPEFGEFATRHIQEPRDSPESKSPYTTTNAFVIDYKQALLDDVVMLAKHQKLKAIAKKFVEEVGIEEALKCLNDVAGPGENQSLLRLWLFQFAKEPEKQLLERARCLEFSEDKKWAMGGIVENILERGLDATSYKQHWLPLQEDETDAFMSLVKGIYKWRNPSREGCSLADAVKMIKDAFPENNLYTKNFITFLDSVSDYKSFETWDVCKAEILSDPLAFQNIRLRLLGSMVATDGGVLFSVRMSEVRVAG